ncbi:MAG: hypothetical protein ACOC43_13745 [Desulfohalobiaceae bacterium]
MITRKQTAAKIADYLQRRINLEELAEWAENAIMEEELEEEYFHELRDIISRLGLADVREFGLTWEDCEDYLRRLGYNITVEISEAV